MEGNFWNEDAFKVLVSAIFGAVIGLEREWSGKSAGFRTMMLVCIGSTLFTIVSFNMAKLGGNLNDVTRIASNIATGIGFIGAGLIFRGGKNVHGLTTAATVWATAAIGMAIGIGNYMVAIAAAIAVWVTLVPLYYAESAFEAYVDTRDYEIRVNCGDGDQPLLPDFFEKAKIRIVGIKTWKDGEQMILKWTVRTSKKHHDRAVAKMLHDKSVLSMTY
ncbi:MAG: MgtC/SapB family protein [Sphingobacteriales bacterium]|nr:MAG: MgtC/SapB family protein [Sphingobacteriales bacterium]